MAKKTVGTYVPIVLMNSYLSDVYDVTSGEEMVVLQM